tara:strand:- start:3540 stop:3707 length:168 start_codon:yes stop_codon:yes gene_type:complete
MAVVFGEPLADGFDPFADCLVEGLLLLQPAAEIGIAACLLERFGRLGIFGVLSRS